MGELQREEEIKMTFELIHEGIEAKNNVFFAVMQKKDTKIIHKFFSDNKKALAWVLDNDSNTYDTYYTMNEFNVPKRSKEYVFTFRGMYYDLDLHGEESQEVIQNQIHFFMKSLSWFIKYERIPIPNLIIATGRGIHLYYVYDNDGLPSKNLGWLQEKLSNGLAEILQELINDGDNVCQFTLDNCYKDTARLLRIPMTFNTAVNSVSEIIYINDERYPVDYFRNFLDIPKPKKAEQKKKETIIKQEETKFINKFLNLHSDRLKDLKYLLELRKYDVIGYRELFLFLIRYYNCFVDINNNDKLIEKINSMLVNPLQAYELKATESAEKAYYKWLLEKKNGYNYQNRTLIRLLDITDEEQQQLKTIISKDEKARRAKLKNWYHDKRDNKRVSKKQVIDNKIKELLEQNKTYEEIIMLLSVSNDRISKIVDKQAKEQEKVMIDEQIIHMLQEGKTYREIMKLLCVSVQRISKLKKEF